MKKVLLIGLLLIGVVNAQTSFTLTDTIYCSTDAAVELTTGVPVGGYYAGDGVVEGYFDPSLLNLGNYDIHYIHNEDTATVNVGVAGSMPNIFVTSLPNLGIALELDIPYVNFLHRIYFQHRPIGGSWTMFGAISDSPEIPLTELEYPDTIYFLDSCTVYEMRYRMWSIDGCSTGWLTATNDFHLYSSPHTYYEEATASCFYTWYGETYTETGRYYHHIENEECDTVLGLDLTITGEYDMDLSVDEETCDGLFWNGVNYTESGVYEYVTQNSMGCDSLITLNLTVNSTSSENFENACDTFYWNENFYTESGVYEYITTNSVGCDSTAYLNLTINNNLTEIAEIACDSLEWNGTTYYENFSGEYILTNSLGCDSVVSIDLAIGESSYQIIYEAYCDSFVWNGNAYYESGSYNYFGTSIAGCDSVTTLDLIVDVSPIVEITQFNNDLEAEAIGGVTSFLWSTWETTSVIQPTTNGLYWCIAFGENNCVSDTAYYEFNMVGMEDYSSGWNVYPNPSRDVFNITFTSEQVQDINVKIVNVIGEVIYQETLKAFTGQFTKAIDLTKEAKGVYTLQVTTESGGLNKKIIFQ